MNKDDYKLFKQELIMDNFLSRHKPTIHRDSTSYISIYVSAIYNKDSYNALQYYIEQRYGDCVIVRQDVNIFNRWFENNGEQLIQLKIKETK